MKEIQTQKRWRRRKDARPTEILQSALTLFSARGFAATRLDEVAKHAGISKGTLYLYFESKAELFKAVVNEFVLPEIGRAEEQLSKYNGSSADLLRIILHQWWLRVGESELCGISKMIIAEADNFPDIAKFYVDEVIHRGRNMIQHVIERGLKSGEFANCQPKYVSRVIIAPLVFAAIWRRSLEPFDAEDYVVKQYIDTHLELFLNGLVKKT